MISGKRINLLVTGSIAAYKSAELVRELVRRGAEVRVVMSRAATEFITPLTLQTLSGNPVTTSQAASLVDLNQELQIGHIALADSADLVLVAPASADFIARAAAGMADDAPTAVMLATKAPVLIAPAMNVNMWQNKLTQRNVASLEAVGVELIPPEEGELACGWCGAGRLAELGTIVERVVGRLTVRDLEGVDVIVTAGPTREPIDPIRFLTNRSSGKMGYAVARAAQRRGASVTLISGPTALTPPTGVNCITVQTASELSEQLFKSVRSRPIEGQSLGGVVGPRRTLVFMVAAVMDYRVVEPAASKIKHDKSSEFSLRLVPNGDILRALGEAREQIEQESSRKLCLIGFNAETGEVPELLTFARAKLKSKRVDLIVANLVQDSFEQDTNRVWLVYPDRVEAQEIGVEQKGKIADAIVSAALGLRL